MQQTTQQVEVSRTASVPTVVVDLVRTVQHRYSLLVESNQIAQTAKGIRAPILTKAVTHSANLKGFGEQASALTEASSPKDFKELWLKISAERKILKTIRTEAANATAEQTAQIGVRRKAMKADDTAIMTKLGDSFIQALLSTSTVD